MLSLALLISTKVAVLYAEEKEQIKRDYSDLDWRKLIMKSNKNKITVATNIFPAPIKTVLKINKSKDKEIGGNVRHLGLKNRWNRN
mgnify:CR=1 FL=1